MRPLIEVVGFGEAQSESPNAQAGEAAIRQALLAGGIEPAQIGCIITSADGIPAMDNAERDALHAVFGAKLEQIPACAPKAAFGEALGASGILLAMTGMAALLEHRVPPTVGAIRGSGLWLSEKPQPIQASYALVNAFSHDGNAASLILGLWKS
jgi:3-oxoacyl-[acyl-carrier-protein] synthase II